MFNAPADTPAAHRRFNSPSEICIARHDLQHTQSVTWISETEVPCAFLAMYVSAAVAPVASRINTVLLLQDRIIHAYDLQLRRNSRANIVNATVLQIKPYLSVKEVPELAFYVDPYVPQLSFSEPSSISFYSREQQGWLRSSYYETYKNEPNFSVLKTPRGKIPK